MSTIKTRRVAGASLAMLGVLALAACNDESVSSATPPEASAPTAQQTQEQSTPSEAPETTEESSTSETSEAPETSDESSSSSSSDESSDEGGSVSGPTKPSDKNAKLKFGDPAVIQDDSKGTFRITVKDLKVAPNSVYKEANLNKSNGTVYYVDFSVTPIKKGSSSSSFTTSSVNGLFLHPVFGSDATTKKRLYGHTTECDSGYDKLSIGQSGDSCYIYQIDGKKLTDVAYQTMGSGYNITWSK